MIMITSRPTSLSACNADLRILNPHNVGVWRPLLEGHGPNRLVIPVELYTKYLQIYTNAHKSFISSN